MGTGSGADALGPGGVVAGDKANDVMGVDGVGGVGGVDAGNKANGVSDAVGVGAGNTTNSGVGTASFVPKTNSSIVARVVCLTG